MGFAYSGGTIIWKTDIRGDTVAHLIEDLDITVVAAGWTARTAITGGFKYTLVSPQGLTCKTKIYAVDSTFAGIQFLSTDEVRTGALHKLRIGAAYNPYQAHCGPCQLLISVHGKGSVVGIDNSRSFQGGIPWVPNPADVTDCQISVGPEVASECWFSSGDSGGGFEDFRTSHGSAYFTACYNGNLLDSSGCPAIAGLRLNTVCLATNVDVTFGVRQRTRFFNNTPLRVEPMICWALDHLSVARVRGTLWDSLIETLERPLDDEFTIIDTSTGFAYPFINYMFDENVATHRSRYGSLVLLKGVTVTSEAGAYWYLR